MVAPINEVLDQFSADYSSSLDDLLQEIEQYTLAHHAQPHMLSGKVQGRFLEEISRMLKPTYVLEIGTFTGFSALCLAKGLQSDGALHTIELREETASIAHNFFQRSTFKEQIKIHVGVALDIIPALPYQWDLVFIDADKTSYITYFDLILPLVKPGGYILADNIFFHGQALVDQPKGKNAKAIKAFNDYIRNHTAVETVVLTIRDGLYLLRKK